MSDFQIELTEALHDFATYIKLEQVIMRGQVQISMNKWFDLLEPRYRLDSIVKKVTESKLPIKQIVYSKN